MRNAGQVGKGILRNGREFCFNKPPKTEMKSLERFSVFRESQAEIKVDRIYYLHLLCAGRESRHDFSSKTRHTEDVPVTLAMSWTIFQR